MADCEKINPYEDDGRAKTEQVRAMFDNIAPAYDFMNLAMTMGIDRLWRRHAIDSLRPEQPRYILDVATGTGDLAMLMAKRLDPVRIFAVDLSEGMLSLGRVKVAEAGLGDVITFSQGDCLHLPFTDRMFDVVTVAYGVRNFENLLEGYREMHRVTRPGGRLMVIELSTPTSPFIKPLYDIYTRRVIPAVGRLISRDSRAYTYLPESIAAVPQGDEMADLMRQAGYKDVSIEPLTFGVCTLYIATA